MRKEYDFSKGKRGPVIASPGKTRITLMLDEETSAAIRRSRAVAAVTEMQRLSVDRGKDAITPAQIEAEIASTRRARRQHRTEARTIR